MSTTETANAPSLDTLDLTRPTTPLLDAAALLGMGRTATYRAKREGMLPFRVIQAGGRYVVATRELAHLLGLDLDA